MDSFSLGLRKEYAGSGIVVQVCLKLIQYLQHIHRAFWQVHNNYVVGLLYRYTRVIDHVYSIIVYKVHVISTQLVFKRPWAFTWGHYGNT